MERLAVIAMVLAAMTVAFMPPPKAGPPAPVPAPDPAEISDVHKLPECGKPCVIEDNLGGNVFAFRMMGLKLLAQGTPVILDGDCISACTLIIDIDHANVCITTGAVLEYHKQHWKDAKGTMHYEGLSYETPGLNAYLASRGGLPETDTLMLAFEQAKQFYKPCPGADRS
jgi:hypothetical protein